MTTKLEGREGVSTLLVGPLKRTFADENNILQLFLVYKIDESKKLYDVIREEEKMLLHNSLL